MTSILNIVLVASLFLQSLFPITSILQAPSDSITESAASPTSELTNIQYSAPIFADQVRSEELVDEKDSQISIKIKASPQLIQPGEPVSINWSIPEWGATTPDQTLSLSFTFPKDVTSKQLDISSSIAVAQGSGSLEFLTSSTTEFPFLIDIALLKGSETVDATSVLISQPSLRADNGKTTALVSSDRRVKLDIPSAA